MKGLEPAWGPRLGVPGSRSVFGLFLIDKKVLPGPPSPLGARRNRVLHEAAAPGDSDNGVPGPGRALAALSSESLQVESSGGLSASSRLGLAGGQQAARRLSQLPSGIGKEIRKWHTGVAGPRPFDRGGVGLRPGHSKQPGGRLTRTRIGDTA